MPFVDVGKLKVVERLPVWYGRYFHSAGMTFAHCEFVACAEVTGSPCCSGVPRSCVV
jgi:hypothetical protein